MKCELDYCIYNKNFYCVLKEIQINSLGMCEECIVVSISDSDLKILKENQLKDIESRWENEIDD